MTTHMTTPSDKSGKDGSFPSFTVGLALGIMGALLFGTDEGRKIVKKVLGAVPDKYKLPPVNLSRPLTKSPIIPLEETPHTTFEYSSPFGEAISNEAPPPPAPHVRPTLSEPFHPNT